MKVAGHGRKSGRSSKKRLRFLEGSCRRMNGKAYLECKERFYSKEKPWLIPQ